MRVPLPTVLAGVVVAVLGAAGLIRGAVPPAAVSGGGAGQSAPIVVTNAYVRPPAPPTDAAAAYFTVRNNTGTPDQLLAVVSGAGATSVLHADIGNTMIEQTDGMPVPAHGSLVLATGKAHVMIEQLYGPLVPGQSVNLALTFADAGTINISAAVIALGAPAPTG